MVVVVLGQWTAQVSTRDTVFKLVAASPLSLWEALQRLGECKHYTHRRLGVWLDVESTDDLFARGHPLEGLIVHVTHAPVPGHEISPKH